MIGEYTRADEIIDLASNNDGVAVIECASGFVRCISYNMSTHTCVLSLDYKGKVKDYSYPDMDFDFFVSFVDSEETDGMSKGEFYNAHIKPKNYPKHSSK